MKIKQQRELIEKQTKEVDTKPKAVLFDFDGTVIDSYPGIQQAFDEAYFLTYGVANEVSIQTFIGPPIDSILMNVTNETDIDKITSFVGFFKNKYDTGCFKASILYDGMKEVLQQLYENGIKLFIVTNKREKATKLIVHHFELSHFFSGIYCSDLKEEYTSKADIVADLLQEHNLASTDCLFIGDTEQDLAAASENDISFVYAAYGYGNLQGLERTIQNPLETVRFINILNS